MTTFSVVVTHRKGRIDDYKHSQRLSLIELQKKVEEC